MSRELGKTYKQIEADTQESFNFSPAARAKDPETSHIAAEKITESGKRVAACNIILAVLQEKDGLTSKEISARCDLDRHQCGRRMVDLEQSNLIRRGEKRFCTVDGGQALEWWIK